MSLVFERKPAATPLVPKLHLGTQLGGKFYFPRRGCLRVGPEDSTRLWMATIAKYNFASQYVPKYNLGTRVAVAPHSN